MDRFWGIRVVTLRQTLAAALLVFLVLSIGTSSAGPEASAVSNAAYPYFSDAQQMTDAPSVQPAEGEEWRTPFPVIDAVSELPDNGQVARFGAGSCQTATDETSGGN